MGSFLSGQESTRLELVVNGAMRCKRRDVSPVGRPEYAVLEQKAKLRKLLGVDDGRQRLLLMETCSGNH